MRRRVRTVRRIRTVAGQAQTSLTGLIEDRRCSPVPCTSWQLKQVTPRVYITLCTKSLPCIRFLCAVPSGEMRERRLAELVLFELPEVLQVQPRLKADRPVVVLPVDRVRRAAVPASGTGCRCRWRARNRAAPD